MPSQFDSSTYAAAPVITAASGLVLARTLTEACPPSLAAGLKKPLRRLAKICETIESELERRKKKSTEEDVRALDQLEGAAFSALRMRLSAWTLLPSNQFEECDQALAALDNLFGAEGLEFLKKDFATQAAAAEAVIAKMHDHHVEKRIRRLVGNAFVDHVTDVHKRYSKMVTARLHKDPEDSANLRDLVHDLQNAIVSYATKVCATVDEDDAETIELASSALRPIDAFRAESTKRAKPADDATTSPSPTDEKSEPPAATPEAAPAASEQSLN
jgi:HPt (histidine-containing phosphotransfer) domain-containing protein